MHIYFDKEKLLHLKDTGFFSVFIGSVICKILSFIGGIIIVRVLSKNDYGIYTYVMNCFEMLVILGDFGFSNAAMQLCNENYRDKKYVASIFYWGAGAGLIFSAVNCCLIILSPFFFPYTQSQAVSLVQSLCIIPFLSVVNSFILLNTRVNLENTLFVKINIFNVIFSYFFLILLSKYWGVRGAVFSVYAVQISILLYGVGVSQRIVPEFKGRSKLDKDFKKSFVKLAFATQLNNGIGAALMLLDVFIIGLVIVTPSLISTYKIASTIPTALSFIPSCVMIYISPYFARNIGNWQWVKERSITIFSGLALVNGLIIILGWILAPYIISLLFGTQYLDAIPCFRILLLSYFFMGSFQIPAANILYTQRFVKLNISVNIISGIVNLILDVLLIKKYGIIGAAIATAFVHVFASFLNLIYLRNIIKGNKP